jgi:tetratricopeptide (TPR) repeat protein
LAALLLGISTHSYSQQPAQASFDQANEQLEAGNYRQAISQYKQLEAQNTISGALYLNLGISYQRIDSLGKAKYYLMKAAQYEETTDKAEQALQFVETQFSRQSAVLPKLPWDVAVGWLQDRIGAENLLAAGIILLNLGVFIFVSHWFLSWNPYLLRIAGYVLVGFSLFVIVTSIYTRYVSERYSTALMVTQKVGVTEQPRQDASLVSQAFEGYTFTVDHRRSNTEPGWSYVRMSNGLYGWIPSSEILIL